MNTEQPTGKAHKVIEHMRSWSDEGTDLPFLIRQIERSYKWILPGADEMPDPDPQILQGMPIHLPCQDALVECDWTFVFEDGEEKGTAIGILTEATPGEISGLFFSLTKSGLGFAADIKIWTDKETGLVQIGAVGHPEMQRTKDVYCETASEHAGVVISWLAALRCTNIESIDNPPPVALNKKRLKQGKQPLFTYKTLHISQQRRSTGGRAGEDSGRNTPRLHFRRGHVRRIDAQRLTWVQPCMVGEKERGTVHKDYVLKAR